MRPAVRPVARAEVKKSRRFVGILLLPLFSADGIPGVVPTRRP
jgi:hypothetical protein